MFLSKFKGFIFIITMPFFLCIMQRWWQWGLKQYRYRYGSVNLMDHPNGEYKAVYVNISEVQVHKAGTTDNDGDDDDDGSWILQSTSYILMQTAEIRQ